MGFDLGIFKDDQLGSDYIEWLVEENCGQNYKTTSMLLPGELMPAALAALT